jgi:polysaccharide pyruvyl transferase WcaK-like protein
VLLVAQGGKCPTAGEVEHHLQHVALQSPPPRIHCFLGKRNVFESEAILGVLEKRGFNPTFSPGVGRRLNEEEIFHLANFLDVLRTNYEFDQQRQDYYRQWRDELLSAGRSDRQPDELALRRAALPLRVRFSRLFAPLRQNGTIDEADPAESEMLKAFFVRQKADAPFGPSRERLKSGGWLSTHMFLVPEPEECSLIERAFQGGREASSTPITPERILLCGWYGTETLGDKAILGGVIDVVRRRWPEVAIDLASLEPYVSRMTVRQMPDLGIERVLTLGEAFATVAAAQYSAVAIAGGPLMSSIPWCSHLLEIFAAAKQAGTKCLIAGCGIGPLYVDYRNAAIKHLLELADEVVLRDQGSAQIARDVLKVERKCEVALDPAFIWIRRRSRSPERDTKQILLALRNWPIEEFAARMERTQAEQIKAAYEKQLILMIDEMLRIDPSIKLVPFCMHKYAVGGDDRIFYRRLLSQFPEILCRVDNRHRTPAEDLDTIARSRAILAMRFHSVVFSLATNTPFLAVDYTLGGKIAGLLDDVGGRDSLVPIDRFDGRNTARRLLSLEHPSVDVTNKITASAAAIDRCFASVPLPAIERSQRDVPSGFGAVSELA